MGRVVGGWVGGNICTLSKITITIVTTTIPLLPYLVWARPDVMASK